MADFILAIDQGTTSSRAIVFGRDGAPRAIAQFELPQIYPQAGWVEHDPERIWLDTVAASRKAVRDAGLDVADIAAIGIANQRETVVMWERASGRPLHNAIVWQDRRTASLCDALRGRGLSDMVQERTGLVIDPYFSATKLAWLFDNVDRARDLALLGEIAFGTVDSFLLWRLTGGAVHATDITNASRTMLADLETGRWDGELFDLFGIPREAAAEIRPNSAQFGVATADFLGREVPILGMAGDQQAAAVGQACIAPGMIKATYGTGAFILLNTGPEPVRSGHRLLTTIAYQVDETTHYAVEGSIFIAGAAVQWLRDALGVVADAGATEALAAALTDNAGVYLVPAFAGLGAPYWNAAARGAVVGLSRNSDAAYLARAALEAAAYQTHDVLTAMAKDGTASPVSLRVDGGMASNSWLLGFLADILETPVERPTVIETTALGAALLAAIGAGWYRGLDEAAAVWRAERRFEPTMSAERRAQLLGGWHRAVAAVSAIGSGDLP
jgi:glycerol kinase